MGALHAGHISLVEASRAHAEKCIVSIFVNPTQFAPTEDFGAYPRIFDADLAKLVEAGAAGCFAPTALQMYPAGFSTNVVPGGPALAGLEDRFRPDHSAGVALVAVNCSIRRRPIAPFSAKRTFNSSR